MEYDGSTFDNTALFHAIEAQLSGLPVVLIRTKPVLDKAVGETLEEIAFKAAMEHRASMVIWIEEEADFQVRFLIPDSLGTRQVFTRTIDPKSNSKNSRYDVIAIAVSGMVEGLLGTRRTLPEKNNVPLQKTEAEPGNSTSNLSGENQTTGPKKKWLELFAAYTGTFFSQNMVSHGATVGLSLLPRDHAVLAVSFTQNVTMQSRAYDVTLRLASRAISVQAAFRMTVRSLELRMGAAWTIDLRSYASTANSDTVETDPDGFRGVHCLGPFVSLAWVFNDRIGLFGMMSATIALNETTYKATRNNENVPVVDPYLVKLAWQFGLTIRI
jgi:hypothetical protein